MNLVRKEKEIKIGKEEYIMFFDMNSIVTYKEITKQSFSEGVKKLFEEDDEEVMYFIASTLRKKENKIQILLQKRSEQKDSFPGCYDISSAGHIPAGDNYGQSAVRELKEELGIVVRESELIDCGNRRFHFEEIFHGRLFKDNQVSKIFVLWKDLEEKDFVFVDHEVSEVKWLDFEKCYQDVKENKINHCIYIEELDIVKKYLRVQ